MHPQGGQFHFCLRRLFLLGRERREEDVGRIPPFVPELEEPALRSEPVRAWPFRNSQRLQLGIERMARRQYAGRSWLEGAAEFKFGRAESAAEARGAVVNEEISQQMRSECGSSLGLGD